jgi:hypothetical protein
VRVGAPFSAKTTAAPIAANEKTAITIQRGGEIFGGSVIAMDEASMHSTMLQRKIDRVRYRTDDQADRDRTVKSSRR